MTDYTGKPADFVTDVIIPVLQALGLDADPRAATQLLLGTALQESGSLKYRVQLGGGPARGLFQMEGGTHDDIWNNFLKYKPDLATKVRQFNSNPTPSVDDLTNNDEYAAAMTRVDYYRVPHPLPAADDIAGMADYWKQYYNTAGGKGTAAEFVTTWNNDGGDAAVKIALA